VSIEIADVAYYKIIDPQKSIVAIEDITNTVNQISQTTVRNVVGQFSLDQLLSKTSGLEDICISTGIYKRIASICG
jgi:regulator of protease activity HflC (stomatin/prohibitin superfamily)